MNRFVLLALVAGCTTTPPANTTPAVAFCQSMYRAYGDWVVACGNGGAFTAADIDRTCDLEGRRVQAGVASFDAASGDACLSALPVTACDDWSVVQQCFGVIAGASGPGDRCFEGRDCTEGLSCNATVRACPGQCESPRKIGEDCDPQGGAPCVRGSVCVGATGQWRCTSPASVGAGCAGPVEPGCVEGAFCSSELVQGTPTCLAARDAGGTCTAPSHCAAPLTCRFESNRASGSCGARGLDGETCRDLGECSTGLVCVYVLGDTLGTCRPPKRAGEACNPAANECGTPEAPECGAETHVCRGRVEPGGPCIPGRLQCEGGYWCDGTRHCVAPVAVGGLCGEVAVVEGAYDPAGCDKGVCLFSGSKGRCVATVSPGGACVDSIQCPGGSCVDGLCVEPAPAGSACVRGDQCRSGACEAGRCLAMCEAE